MKKFLLKYKNPKKESVEFDEEHLPRLFFSNNHKWWLTNYVLKLEVGKIVRTNSHTVERIK